MMSSQATWSFDEVIHGGGIKIFALTVGWLSAFASLKLFTAALLLAMLTMSWEMVTCWWATESEARTEYDWTRVIGGKLIVLSLVVPCLVLDWIVMFGTDHIRGVPPGLAYYLPITVGGLAFIMIAQSLQGVQNVRNAEGDDNIPRVLIWFLHQLKKQDEKRYPHPGVPHRRWWDDLTEDEVREFLAKRKEVED
jgi:hypothetical protein